MVTYDWRIDLALLLGIANGAYAILERRNRRRKERVAAYELVYDDACFVLEYPFRKKRQAAKRLQYRDDNQDFERAVRLYLDAHELNQMYGNRRYVPDYITDTMERHEYLMRVAAAAHAFREHVFREQRAISEPELSPVMYLDDDELATRINRIIANVGRHLSQFSNDTRRLWEDAKSTDPEDVKEEYARSLDVCQRFFEHNPRGFDDPFVDLPDRIRREYRELLMTPRERLRESFDRNTRWMPFWLRYPKLSFQTRRRFRRRPGLNYQRQ
jgi:hypothetical protein